MNLLRVIRRHLSWKLFLSYLIVVVVGSLVLLTVGEFVMPGAFERHLAAMVARVGSDAALVDDLFGNFRQALTEALVAATLFAGAVSLGLSVYISRRIVAPIREMMRASRRIAAGRYDERVALPLTGSMPQATDELGELALSFNQMADRLEQTETKRIELIGDVAHELRTPLTSIKGYMEGLIDGVLPAEASTFQKVYREADRLQRLIYDLQELSRVESGAFTLNLRPLRVPSLLTATVDRLGPQFDEKGVALGTELPPDLPPIRGEGDRLGQVLLNLVGNALQHTPSGGRVILSARREGSFVRIAVTDTGVGIAPEHIPRLFDRFYRVDRSRSRASGGSGVGLTIAKHLVEAHGGEITAASEGPNRGSTFTFTVPVA